MSNGHCDAGERCSCGLDQAKRDRCNLWKPSDEAIKVFGLVAMHPDQKPLIDKHCFGDCGKVSMAGAIEDATFGPMWVCCETVCPWLKGETSEPIGKTMSFGRPHVVYLRAITDTPSPQSAKLGARSTRR